MLHNALNLPQNHKKPLVGRPHWGLPSPRPPDMVPLYEILNTPLYTALPEISIDTWRRLYDSLAAIHFVCIVYQRGVHIVIILEAVIDDSKHSFIHVTFSGTYFICVSRYFQNVSTCTVVWQFIHRGFPRMFNSQYLRFNFSYRQFVTHCFHAMCLYTHGKPPVLFDSTGR